MTTVLVTLWPLFTLIVAGYLMERKGFPGAGFWPGAERFNYFVLFPALLFLSLATAPFGNPALPHLLVAIVVLLALLMAALVLMRRIRRWPAARFGVFLQGTLRFNTYLGLAVTSSLFGRDGLQLAAVMLALLVPAVNVLSVWSLSSDGKASFASLLGPIIRNPLILACLAGATVNLLGIPLGYGVDGLLKLLAGSSLPLGLLSVGAALRPQELGGEIGSLVANGLARLVLVPLLAYVVARQLGLPAIESTVLVTFFALPTAPTSYVLTRQMGGDGHLMAGVITLQTLLSALTLSLTIGLLTMATGPAG
jgi:malonate transporter and related proteins